MRSASAHRSSARRMTSAPWPRTSTSGSALPSSHSSPAVVHAVGRRAPRSSGRARPVRRPVRHPVRPRARTLASSGRHEIGADRVAVVGGRDLVGGRLGRLALRRRSVPGGRLVGRGDRVERLAVDRLDGVDCRRRRRPRPGSRLDRRSALVAHSGRGVTGASGSPQSTRNPVLVASGSGSCVHCVCSSGVAGWTAGRLRRAS